MPGIGGIAGIFICGMAGICPAPGAGGAAGTPAAGLEATDIMRVYSPGPCATLGMLACCGADGNANAWVAPPDTAYRGGGGGAADGPGAEGNPDASGKAGPWVPGGGEWKNCVNSPPCGWLSGTGIGSGD